jgi:hypothetical protein
MALRFSSIIHVPTIHLSSSVSVQQKTTGTSVWIRSYLEGLDVTVSWEVESYILLSPPYPVRGRVCTHAHFRVTYRELAVLKNVGVRLITSTYRISSSA